MLRATGVTPVQLAALVPMAGRAVCPEVLPPGSSILDQVCQWHACHKCAGGHTPGHLPVVAKKPLNTHRKAKVQEMSEAWQP